MFVFVCALGYFLVFSASVLRQIARYLPHHTNGNASKTHPKSAHDKFKTVSKRKEEVPERKVSARPLPCMLCCLIPVPSDQILRADGFVCHHAVDCFSKHVGDGKLFHLRATERVGDAVGKDNFLQFRILYTL